MNPAMVTGQRMGGRRRRRALDRILALACGVGLGLLIHWKVVDSAVVEGSSMLPTFHPGDRLIIEKVTPRLGVLERGDVVVLRPPDAEDLVVKRVIGLPGEKLHALGGRVYVDGQPTAEEYTITNSRYWFPPIEIPEGEVFVLGDNRLFSDDSTMWGPRPISAVVGKVIGKPLQCLPSPRRVYAQE
ncbi:MAG: signal peptidase I [Armatimonadota bacterium]